MIFLPLLIWATITWDATASCVPPVMCDSQWYKIERNGVQIGLVDAPTTTFVDTQARTGDVYRVRGSNMIGDGPYSAEVPLLTVAQAPSSASISVVYATFVTLPQDLTGKAASANSIQLTWSAITDPRALYITVRVSLNGGPFTLINGSKQFTSQTPTFTHSGLAPGSYKYQLRVWNTSDQLLGESNQSNTVTI